MKLSYTIAILVLLIIMLFVVQRAKRKNNILARKLIRLMYAVAVTVLSSVGAIVVPSESVALFMQTLHFASTEWMLIFLLAFFEEYGVVFSGRQPVRIAVYLYSTVSSIIVLLNVFFNHVVYCEYKVVGEISYRMFRTVSPWYQIHEYFSYFIAGFALLVLIVETVKAKSFYRMKYFPAVIAFLITLGLEGVCSAKDLLMDYALFGYICLGIFLTYYSVYYVNNRLITKTLSYVTTETAGGVVCFDLANKCIYANEVAIGLYENVDDISDFETAFSRYEYGKQYPNKKWVETFLKEDQKQHFEISYGRLEDDKKEYIGCYFYLYDKTEDVLKLEEARYQVNHDTLTGLYNEIGFADGVSGLREELPDEEMYIVAADIRDFKLINDLYGYEVGDKVLIDMAKTIGASLPKYALMCRETGDHFYICIKKSDFSEEKALQCEKMIADMYKEYDFQMIIHYGVYQVGSEDTDVSIMRDYARMAMQRIKDDYDRRFEYFDISMMDEILRVKEMVKKYDDALQSNQFKMFLQPQVVPGGEVVGAEALVRWEDPERGMISPGVFIPVFEDIGLIYKLDQYIWEQAVKQLKAWSGTKRDHYYISVNISTKDFQYIDVYKTFVDLVEKYDISPSKLKLEITESAFMKESEKQLALLDRLQKYGFAVEIDDFGSGYSSFNILKDMKANVLKIDMGFLRKTTEVERSRTIIDSIIKMAKVLKMEVVSEGVEEEVQVNFLTEAGCDIFQGYFFDRPIPVFEFEKKY